MKKIILFAALLVSAAPVATATSSADMETIAKLLEQSGPSATLNSQLLTLLREPAKTLDGVTLPTTAAQYTTAIDTALKLRPKGWVAGSSEQLPAATGGINCTAHLSFWVPDGSAPGIAGLRMESFAGGKGNCASVLSAAEARAWGWKLKQVGR